MGKRQITRGSELTTYATIPAFGSTLLRHNGHQMTHKADSGTHPTLRDARPYTPTRPLGGARQEPDSITTEKSRADPERFGVAGRIDTWPHCCDS
ncbi:hypothetical protein GCM10010377_46400 [Streptomyces viridiviolaceus]|nr:hypothetical protein GCM10010377_46400 [Streptomyces viridiviolaceus]